MSALTEREISHIIKCLGGLSQQYHVDVTHSAVGCMTDVNSIVSARIRGQSTYGE